MNAAFTKGKFINQMQQRFAKCQFIKRGRPQLAQQLAGGEMNAAGELIDLAGCGLNLRRITRPLHQLRLDLNGGDVLTDFVVQLSRRAFSRVLLGVDQLFRQCPPRCQLGLQPLSVMVQV